MSLPMVGQLLVLHGDTFDAVVKHARWLAMLGDSAYDVTLLAQSAFEQDTTASSATNIGLCPPI